MLTLFLSKDPSKAAPFKNLMEDEMWVLVRIQLHDGDTYLDVEGNYQIHAPHDIIKFLNKDLPPITRQVRNARKATAKAFKHALKTGELRADPLVVSTRRSICATCPFKQRKLLGEVCTKCGCNIKRKTTTPTEECPLGKW